MDWNTGDDKWDGGDTGTWNAASGDARAAEFNGDSTGGDNYGADNAADGGGGNVNGGAGNNCGQEGHFSRECTEPKKMVCFNCNEEGHAKSECTKPKVFTGKCRECDQEGHQSRDCPSKPKMCVNCKEEGHVAIDCEAKMKLNLDHVPEKTTGEAWAMLTQASDERDLDDFKEVVKILSKADPELTYVDLEKEFRTRDFSVYLIGVEKECGPTFTHVDLQGNIGKKFAIGYYLNEKAQRPTLVPKWPKTPEENLERLADVGMPLDRGIDLCNNCGELGHAKRNCPQEVMAIDRVTITCKLCDQEGHRVRDCPEERPKPRGPKTCKVCESEDHIAKECPNREKRTCHKCGSEDHMSKECDTKKCTNCDAEGHEWRDCTAPKDWSRVKCRNCGEMGHTIKRCKQPIKEEEKTGGDGGFGDAGASKTDGGSGGWNSGAGAADSGSGQASWESKPAGVIAGGW